MQHIRNMSKPRVWNGHKAAKWKVTQKLNGGIMLKRHQSDYLQAGRTYIMDRNSFEGMTHVVEILDIRRTDKAGYGWMILGELGGVVKETWTMQQAMDCTWKETREYEKRNREKGFGIRLDVRAMPKETSRAGLLLYKEWQAQEDLRVLPERDTPGDGEGTREPAA